MTKILTKSPSKIWLWASLAFAVHETPVAAEERNDHPPAPLSMDVSSAVAVGEETDAKVQKFDGQSFAVQSLTYERDDFAARRLHDRRVARRELLYQALNVIDAVQTISCLDRGRCHEMNPILGKFPSQGEVIAFKAASGGTHFLITKLLDRHAPETLGVWQMTTLSIQGGVVAWNLQFSF